MPGGRIPQTGLRFRYSRLSTPGQWRAFRTGSAFVTWLR